MSDKCTDLFRKLKIWADEVICMHKFVECVKEWIIDWNKGNVRITLIDLHELDKNFPDTDLFIAFDDSSTIWSSNVKNTENLVFFSLSINVL